MKSSQSTTLAALAQKLGVSVRGQGTVMIDGIAPLSDASYGDLSFLTNVHYQDQLRNTKASAVILSPEHQDLTPLPCLISPEPYACYARLAQLLFPTANGSGVVSKQANVHEQAILGLGVTVEPFVVIEANAQIGDGAWIGSGSYIGENVIVGSRTRIYPRVTIYAECLVGADGIVHSGVVIGADGFGMAPSQGGWIKIPQVGRVVIGNQVEIGANTTIDRGALVDTVLEDGVKLDNQIQIGHNCRIGAHTVIAGCAGISGSAKIGRYCMIGGGVGIVGHLEICDHVTITGFSLITKSITQKGTYSSGIPSLPQREWLTILGYLRRLPKWAKKNKEIN